MGVDKMPCGTSKGKPDKQKKKHEEESDEED